MLPSYTRPVIKCSELLQHHLRLLVIEDDKYDRAMMRELLCSPLYDITMAENFKAASQAVGCVVWHCWIVDLELGDGNGMDLLKAHPNFQFKIVVSGLGSMQAAFEATRSGGALAVFDKGSPELAQTECYTIDKIAALGFIMKGHCPSRLHAFLALLEHDFRTVKTWAETIATVPRNLEVICDQFVSLTPLRTLIAFKALTYVLGQTGIARGRGQYRNEEQSLFAIQCLETFLDEWDSVYGPALTS